MSKYNNTIIQTRLIEVQQAKMSADYAISAAPENGASTPKSEYINTSNSTALT